MQVPAKILSCSWTPDGQFMALGLLDGSIRIHNKAGAEHQVIAHRQDLKASWDGAGDPWGQDTWVRCPFGEAQGAGASLLRIVRPPWGARSALQ